MKDADPIQMLTDDEVNEQILLDERQEIAFEGHFRLHHIESLSKAFAQVRMVSRNLGMTIEYVTANRKVCLNVAHYIAVKEGLDLSKCASSIMWNPLRNYAIEKVGVNGSKVHEFISHERLAIFHGLIIPKDKYILFDYNPDEICFAGQSTPFGIPTKECLGYPLSDLAWFPKLLKLSLQAKYQNIIIVDNNQIFLRASFFYNHRNTRLIKRLSSR